MPALRQGDALARPGLGTEILTLLLEADAEAGRRGESAEAAHGIVALLERPMVLLDAIVFVAAGAVGDVVAERLADGARVGVVPCPAVDSAWAKKRWAASMSRFLLSSASTRLPSRSIARYR